MLRQRAIGAMADGTGNPGPMANAPRGYPRRSGPGHGGAWRTWLVAGAIYGGWFLLTFHASALPWWLLLPAGAFVVCWHGSLQHETVHGHPTRSARANGALGWPPLGLWLPYEIYRDTHLRHHACPALTDPVEDTESHFVRQADWDRMSGPGRLLLRFNGTLSGRLILGPALAAFGLWRSEFRRARSGDPSNGGVWLRHVLGTGLVLGWVVFVCELSIGAYVALFAYPGLSLTLLRSYAEHQPAAEADRRTAIVLGGPLSRLLYLNNNLHVVHHNRPGMPWHAIPAEFSARRNLYVGEAGGHVYRSYAALLRRFLFRAGSHPVHPAHRTRAAP